ncbi:MAG: DNA polymerase III subunit delta' C-terminal domain-containing protein [Clostridiales bacterium]
MNFKNIVGQSQILNNLNLNIQNKKINHANLFIGEEGIGKKTLAIEYAKIILCNDMTNCGKCISCKTFKTETNPDYKFVKSDKKTIGVDIVRNIQNDISIMPVYGNYKVYIFTNIHLMTIQAQNALLKTLEEPPEYVVLILTSPNLNQILDTVISRSIIFNFKKNTKEDVELYIKENYTIGIEQREFAVKIADGIIGKAKKVLENENFLDIRNNVIEFIRFIINKDYNKTINIYEFFNSNKDNIDDIFLVMNLFYRDILVYLKTKNEKILINSDKKDIIIDIFSKVSSFKIENDIKFINDARRKINTNVNFQLVIEVMLLKLQEEIIKNG